MNNLFLLWKQIVKNPRALGTVAPSSPYLAKCVVAAANIGFYRDVHGFDATFAAAVTAALDFLDSRASQPANCYLIAESRNRPIGCIFLCAETPTEARIRLFYLDKAHRGQGIGRRLLRAVLSDAQDNGVETVRVSTFDRHPEACALYASAGFDPVASARALAFGQVMTKVDYDLRLGRRGQ